MRHASPIYREHITRYTQEHYICLCKKTKRVLFSREMRHASSIYREYITRYTQEHYICLCKKQNMHAVLKRSERSK
jgi:hypothetical protein